MYKINWEKYLPVERDRKTKSITGKSQREENLDKRNPYESDFGRVIFSAAARRMHDKTQVFPLTSGDYVHTRLTHSMEVMNIAVSLGSSFCRHNDFKKLYGGEKALELEQKICAVLKTAAFVHDIGNPPFGHYGEESIKRYFINKRWKKFLKETIDSKHIDKNIRKKIWEEYKECEFDYTEFDGNAEGFRILTKGQYLGDLSGLNLTFASLGAYLKYPNPDKSDDSESAYVGLHKHGIFSTEREIFWKVVNACHMQTNKGYIKRHPLSFLVEAADSICYYSMDLEDGITTGKINIGQLFRWVDEYVNENVNHECFATDMMSRGKFSIKKLLKLKNAPYKKKNDVDFRVALVSYFVNLALKNFISNLKSIDSGDYKKELLEDDPLKIAKAISKFTRKYLFSQECIISAELTGNSVISGLLDLVLERVLVLDPEKDIRIYRMMSDSGIKLVHQECMLYNPQSKGEFEYNIKDLPIKYRLRLVVDWISGMTDKYAVEMYQKLSGIKL